MTLKEILEEVNDLSYSDFPTKIAGYTINVEQDTYPDNPRDWCSPFTMVCGHRRYNLGDEQWQPKYRGEYAMYEYFHGMSGLFQDKGYYGDFSDEELRSIANWTDRNILWLPLYLYDHSGITMKTTPFRCPWDSGMVGFIWISREDARKEWNWKRITKSREKRVYTWMNGEVETYDQYLRGEVYEFSIGFNGEIIDSCGGIHDDYDFPYIKQEYIIPAIEHHFQQRQTSRYNQLKTWIKNHVPLQVRQQELINLAI